MKILYTLNTPDGKPLLDWPLRYQTPTYGDLIEISGVNGGVYQVIRRRWDLTDRGQARLEIVAARRET